MRIVWIWEMVKFGCRCILIDRDSLKLVIEGDDRGDSRNSETEAEIS